MGLDDIPAARGLLRQRATQENAVEGFALLCLLWGKWKHIRKQEMEVEGE